VTSHGDRPTPTGAPTVRDRARGALIGAGLGDAVGAVFEGGPPVPDPALDAVLDGDAPLRFTDDTALTMALARSLVEVGDLDPDHLAAAFVDAYRADPGRGYGSGMRHWCDQVGRGVPWAAAAAGQFGGRGSFGNGAAMRVAPAAVLAISDPFRALRLAATQAAVTHAHPVAVDGARVQAGAVVDALGGPTVPDPVPSGTRPAMVAAARTRATTPELAAALARLAELRSPTPLDVVRAVGSGVSTAEAVPAALAAAVWGGPDVVGSIRFAVAMGGDTDTVASMAAAITGARCGASSIPAALCARLEGATVLGLLADDLLAAGTRPVR